ncbi:MAG: alkaline phosphatase D family protein [Hyphomonadaceae bacterium]|nr:alkaline phosphatase D family protein [Hyphomonadaceae bacterium]
MGEKFTRRSALGLIGATTTAAACARPLETPPYEGVVAFNHGVASGDPRDDGMIIWTRVTPDRAGAVPVRWIVARNRELSDVVKSGVVQATEARDYTLKIDVRGLRPGAPYFYGFRAGDQHSTVGKARTLPRGDLNKLTLGVVSCASYTHGFFNAYEALAAREDIDAVVHLGDYIYEYGLAGYGGDTALQLGRVPEPEIELNSLQDYRRRHAQYKTDADLQAAHAAAPWIVVWDDHEVANDSWVAGAENHNADEGEWANRKRAALQAYYEWMPIREPEQGRAFEAINRSFRFGDLATLVMLETRLLARTQPFDYETQLPLKMTRWNFANPSAPVALRPTEPDVPGQRLLPTVFEEIGGQLVPLYDWRRTGPALADPAQLPRGFHFSADLEALNALLNAPERALLGQAQEQWFAQELAQSKARGDVWQIVGNQIVMAPVAAPDLSQTPAALAQQLDALRPGVSRLFDLTREPIPMNVDAWDGYPAVRARVLAAMRQAGGNTIVVSGDSHTAWANELNDAQGRVAVEFGATSVTSPSDAQYFEPIGIPFSAGVRARNPHVKYTDGVDRGFLVLTLTRTQANAEFVSVSTVADKNYQTRRTAAFNVAADAGAGIGPLTPA